MSSLVFGFYIVFGAELEILQGLQKQGIIGATEVIR